LSVKENPKINDLQMRTDGTTRLISFFAAVEGILAFPTRKKKALDF